MKRTLRLLTLAAGLLMAVQLMAANTKETVEQVTETVTLTGDVDYTVSSPTPFGDGGVVNIQNTDHAVLILSGVKPSAALPLLASHVQIDGAKAVNNTNCQVKMHNRGCIILPYGNSTRPLTVYSEQNFEGEAVNSFGLESDGGYMNTLSTAKLNNRIRSFKLKRGYMVTFSLKPGGRGYSRCFIAADQDLEVPTLPIILDRSISSYRVFKWYDAGKPALANDTRAVAVDALNVTSCYSFGLGESRAPDAECIPHHIYEDWPSSSACGNVNYSPHMKTNNEPRNSADDHPQDLATILNNWENLMRTGMRLCSPSSWDGSDYVGNASGFLRQFFDSIDARGWRCDIIDLHCYWAEGTFGSIKNWVNAVHRPVWISEWVWGASWNNNGIFGVATGDNRNNPTPSQLNQNRDAVQRICNALNSYDYVERYFYWNSEANCSKLYYDGALTPAGQMYAQLDGGLAYNGKYDYVPALPKQVAPSGLSIDFDKQAQKATLTWKEYNGEMNEYILVERSRDGGATWETAETLTPPEEAGTIVVSDIEAQAGWRFRISEKNAKGTLSRSNVVMATGDLDTGDAVSVDGKTMYLGGNLLPNGSFDMGTRGWTDGTGLTLGQPWFQAVPVGGPDGGPYLQCYGNGSTIGAETSIKTVVPITPDAYYYFAGDACNLLNNYSQVLLSTDGITAGEAAAQLDKTSGAWTSKFSTFNSGSNGYAILGFRSLNSKAQFANINLRRLFDTQEEAYADGAQCERQRGRLAADYVIVRSISFESQLEQTFDDKREEARYLRQLVDDALAYDRYQPLYEQLADRAIHLAALYPSQTFKEEVEALLIEPTADGDGPSLLAKCEALRQLMDQYVPMGVLAGKVQNPEFTTEEGWQTKAGTYQGGDQRRNQYTGETMGFPYWNAWWGLPASEAEGQTLAIRQTISNKLDHGLYALRCVAATEHYCLSDQCAYITNGTDSLTSPTLTADYLDLPTVSDSLRWQQLQTLPVYVADGGTLHIGFQSSKQGATDDAWRRLGGTSSKGDQREGWWGASKFELVYHPLYRLAATPGQYDVACLPYAADASQGLRFYEIAAITSDYTTLCLRQIDKAEAGVPFIYMSDGEEAVFLEHGEKTGSRTDAPGNLRGFFTTTASVPTGSYALANGKWTKVGSTRPAIGNYRAYMRSMTDKASGQIPVVESWSGPTMPIEGVTAEEIAAGIGILPSDGPATATLHTIGGQRVSHAQPHPGIYIQTRNGKATKTIIK